MSDPWPTEEALEIDGNAGNDYVLRKAWQSCWIEVDDALVYIHRTDEGLVVDIFDKTLPDAALGDAVASCYVFNSELGPDEDDSTHPND